MNPSLSQYDEKIKLLFVCLGNICRSPAAEGIMKALVEKKGVSDRFYIDSAGTGGWHSGELPDARMRQHGAKRGYVFCSRARKISEKDFDHFDYIVVMDHRNFSNVKSLARGEEDVRKIKRMTDFSKKFIHGEVPDPYYGGDTGFELVLDLLEDACSGFLTYLQR